MKVDGATVQTKFVVKREPEHGSHPLWCVYEKTEDDFQLICGCTYLKGAEALVERLCETERQIRTLLSFRNLEVKVEA